jgi:hypothetical protein
MPKERWSRMNRLRLAFAIVLLLPGCSDDTQRPKDTVAAVAVESRTPNFQTQLLDIAATYESYGRFSTRPRYAIAACMPIPVISRPPLGPLLSGSDDPYTHGRKLYYLFVKDAAAFAPYNTVGYEGVTGPSPVGQVVVKESWLPEEVKNGAMQLEPVTRTYKVRVGKGFEERQDKFLPFAQQDGHSYRAKEKWALFIMYKLEPKTPGTDEGWVYGTVTADGKKVTGAGRIESCMGCHRDAPHDRLFGLAEDND